PAVEGFAGGEPGGLAAGSDRRRLPARHLLSQERPESFGGFPPLCFGGGQHVGGVATHVRQPPLAQQLDDLIDRCLSSAHRISPALPICSHALVEGCSEWSSPACRRSVAGWAARMEARSPSPNR